MKSCKKDIPDDGVLGYVAVAVAVVAHCYYDDGCYASIAVAVADDC